MRRAPDQIDAFRTYSEVPREPERAAPYQPSSDTSRLAAERVQPKAEAMRETVYQAIADSPNGLTRKEIVVITGYLTQTACPRINELEQMRRIRKLKYFDLPTRTAKTVRREACSVYVVDRGYPDAA